MKCLLKWKWIKLPRDLEIEAKGLMTYYTRLARDTSSNLEMRFWICGAMWNTLQS